MPAASYTLVGFGGFLERRRVTFAEPLPSLRICNICGVVPSRTLLLPCCHALCEPCKGLLGQAGECPADGCKFSEEDVLSWTFKLCDLEEHRVFCPNAGRNCGFVGELRRLKEHLLGCGKSEVKCAKCDRCLTRELTAQHYQDCCDRAVRTATLDARDVQMAMEGIAGIKEAVGSLRERASGVEELEAILTHADTVVECASRLEAQLLQLNSSGVEHGAGLGITRAARTNRGPYRAAPRPGVSVTMCEYDDLYKMFDSLAVHTEVSKVGPDMSLNGYTFRVDCTLEKEGNGEATICFAFFLKGGSWDSYVQWPFAGHVTLVVTHIRDTCKDIKLSLTTDGADTVMARKKPAPDRFNVGLKSEKIPWKDIEIEGFIDNDKMYLNIELE